MNNEGFAITGIMYSVLLIFLVMLMTMLFNLQNRKTILDELKMDTIDAVESENNIDYLLEEITKLKTLIGGDDISNLGNGTITGILSGLDGSSNVRYDSESDTIQVQFGTKWVSVYNCGLVENALIPVMTNNSAPKGKVTASNSSANAYKAFGNMPATATNGYAFTGYNDGSTGALTLQYEFELPVNIRKIELIPYKYLTANYATFSGATYTVQFVHSDNTITPAYTHKTTALAIGTRTTPPNAYTLTSVDIDRDNLNVKAIKIVISGWLYSYSGGDTVSYARPLNYFQAYGTVAY